MQQIIQPETTNWLVQVMIPLAAIVIPAIIVIYLSVFRTKEKK